MEEDGAAGASVSVTLLAQNVLRALAGSRLTVEERAEVCGGVIRSLTEQSSGSSSSVLEQEDYSESLLVGVAALPDAEDVLRRVEASWLVLQERLRSALPAAIEKAAALEVGGLGSGSMVILLCCRMIVSRINLSKLIVRRTHTQAQRWIERVALPVVRSERQDVMEACNFIGLHAIGTLMALCRDHAAVQACVEAATLSLLEDVAAAATRGAEESSQVLAARVRWIAAFLAASGDAGNVPVPVVERFLSIVRHHAQPATRSAAILSICPALVGILNQDSALCMQIWRLVVGELGGLEPIDHLRDAFAMLCVLYECFRPLLSRNEHEELWRLLHRGA